MNLCRSNEREDSASAFSEKLYQVENVSSVDIEDNQTIAIRGHHDVAFIGSIPPVI